MKKITTVTAFAVTIFSLTIFFSCSKKNNPETIPFEQTAKADFEMDLESLINEMTLEEKISQMFLINLENNDTFLPVEFTENPETKESKTLMPGGYIFFGYNVADNPKQIIEFTDSIKKHAQEQKIISPYLSIDVEGGYVNRLRNVAGPLPENERVCECVNPKTASELYSYYAKQLFALGINFNLAPVSEICTDDNKDFLDGRSYGSKENVIEYSKACVNSYEKQNVGTILKHFPGNNNVDPHLGLPNLSMSGDDYKNICETFGEIIKDNPSGILMSHAVVKDYDSRPACLSYFWITEVLRDKLNYQGLIFSDDIFMNALLDNGYPPEKASEIAIRAGINCIMISEKKFGKWMKVITELCKEDKTIIPIINDSVKKILKFKIEKHIICSDNILQQGTNNKISIINEIPFSENLVLAKYNKQNRIFIFNLNKFKTIKLYYKYFYNTASKDEKHCAGIR